MENGKHKTNSSNSSNSWSKKQSLLPSLQGGAGGRHPFREGQGVGFPLTKREARLTKRACERLTKCEARLTHKKGVPSVSSVSGVSFRFWTKKTPVFGPNRNKTSVSSVSGVSGVSFRFWTKKSPVFGPNRNKTGVSSVSAVPSVPQSLLPSLQGGAGGRL